jgi:hypothetical protein
MSGHLTSGHVAQCDGASLNAELIAVTRLGVMRRDAAPRQDNSIHVKLCEVM